MHKILSWFHNSKDFLFSIDILTLKTFEPHQKVTPITYIPAHCLMSSLLFAASLLKKTFPPLPPMLRWLLALMGLKCLLWSSLQSAALIFFSLCFFFLFETSDKAQTGTRRWCCHSKASRITRWFLPQRHWPAAVYLEKRCRVAL